jgi:hypothetical protein
MLVSGFTLAYSPAGSKGNPVHTSGYELELTNLSDNEIRFDVLARVTRYAFTIGPPESQSRVLAHLKDLIPGVLQNDRMTWFDSEWVHGATGYVLRTTIPIAPHTSELFEMAPSLYQSEEWWPRVAGHVEVIIPALLTTEPPYEWIPQADGAVPVLLNPSTVEAWEVHTGGGGGAFAYSRTSPPLSSGQAYQEIVPFTELEVLERLDG